MDEVRCHLPGVLLAVLAAGCVSPMSTLQTAKTTPAGKISARTGVGANVNTAYVGSVLASGKLAAKRAKTAIDGNEQPELSEREREDIVKGAFASALYSPLPLFEVGLSYGITDFWDAGLDYTTSGFRLHTKFQFLKQEQGQGLDASIGLEFLRQSFSIPLPGVIKDVFDITDFGRTDLSIPALVSREFEYGMFYSGLRFNYSLIRADILERISERTGLETQTSKDMWSLGGVIGGGLGYRQVFLMLELNVAYFSYEPTLLGVKVDLSGVNFYPAVGLGFRFY